MGFRSRVLAVVLLAIGLAACASRSDDAAAVRNRLAQLADVPLPRGYDVDDRNTVIFGDGERWNGRVAYRINSSAPDMYEFYRREMPKLGWNEMSVLRAPTSVMTYSRLDRVATIQISNAPLYGTDVELVVAPTTTGQGSSAPPPAPAIDRNAPAYRAPDSGTLRPDELPPPITPPGSRAITVEPAG